VKKFNKYYDELTKKEHSQINHRLIALKRLIKKLEIC
jgi:inosine/xanthosine triphosphate pyrophosphatase family protein